MNNDNKRGAGNRFAAFIGGKGFYIALFLCVAVIGVSAWTLNLTMRNAGQGLTESLEIIPAITLPSPSTPSVQSVPGVVASPRTTYTPPPVAATTPSVQPPDEQPDVQADTPSDTQPQPVAAIPEEPVQEVQPVSSIPDAFVWPVAGNVAHVFAMDKVVYDRTMLDWRAHRGIDITADLGSAVRCAAAGTVESVITEPLYGTSVTVTHSGGMRTVYRNLAANPPVGVGMQLSVGDVLGAVAASASAEIGDVAHLHFEMYLNGTPTDPTEYLPNR